MSTFTENYSLIKPDGADYYDVADFNENMDTLDRLMADGEEEMEKISEKIGEKDNEDNGTVFGKLNQVISSVGGGISLIKSIQKAVVSFVLRNGEASATIDPVDASRCVVIMEYLSNQNIEYLFSYTLSNDKITVETDSGYGNTVSFGFWIIEFY